jgi:hypothetical protein
MVTNYIPTRSFRVSDLQGCVMRVRCPDVRNGCEKVQQELGAELRALQLFWAGTVVEFVVLGKIVYERQIGSALNSWLNLSW